MNYMEWDHCFSEYQILVPYEFLVWNISFKKKKELMKMTSKTREVVDFANGIKLCFLS